MRRSIVIACVLALVTGCGGTAGTTTSSLPTTTISQPITTTGSTDTSSTVAGSTTTIPDDADHELRIEGFAFSGPDTVGVGDTILVTNDDSLPHTWTSTEGGWNSGTLTGQSFFYTFERAGTFEYFCGIHAEMRGNITVED